ncbi:MAG TPA: tetratricopeptide repeat protein [Pseudoxanthomonas sp.]|jgi:hypothetical protein|nr:tetratricopeptide repeat protein [Pseudoxanthomonas sp.]
MHPLLLLTFACQLAVCVHVVRTGRPLYWIAIVVMVPLLGMLVYGIAEVLPDLQNNPAARRAARQMRSKLDPDRDRRLADRRLGLSDTPETRRQLAEECLARGDVARAEELFQTALTGLYKTDPDLMLGLAKAQFALGKAGEARATLDALMAANPGFRSIDGHLLYARAVQALGDVPAALHEYEAVVQGFPGEEARARYALLLKQNGQTAQARKLFQEILTRSDALPRYYQRDQREWIQLARSELTQLPG